jgi:hypothetical protein
MFFFVYLFIQHSRFLAIFFCNPQKRTVGSNLEIIWEIWNDQGNIRDLSIPLWPHPSGDFLAIIHWDLNRRDDATSPKWRPCGDGWDSYFSTALGKGGWLIFSDWWLMMVDDGWWWLMMVDDGWWWLMIDGDLFSDFHLDWWLMMVVWFFICTSLISSYSAFSVGKRWNFPARMAWQS